MGCKTSFESISTAYAITIKVSHVPSVREYLQDDGIDLKYNSSILVIRALRAKFPCK